MGGTGGAAGAGGGAGGESVWEALASLKSALEASPDHREAEAARAVASKDPDRVFRFVRDSIAVIPIFQSAAIDTTFRRWGTRATLRGGAGTMRERADLLADLLTQAGFQASVVTASARGLLAASESRAAVFGPRRPAFQPGAGPSGGWDRLLPRKQPLPTFDPAAAIPLADGLLARLPAGAIQADDDGLPSIHSVPLVSFVRGGATVLANTLLPTATLDDAMVGSPSAADKATDLPRVQVELLASRTDAPTRRVSLVAGSYGLDELVGRALIARLVPPLALADAISQPAGDTFAAALGLVGPGLKAADSRAISGALLTLGGDVVTAGDDGKISFNGAPLAPDDSAAAARVASLAVEAHAEAFPYIQLRISALDAQGQPVAGVGGALRVTEEDQPRPALVQANAFQSPRVLFVLDISGSQPAALQGADGRRALGQQLGSVLTAQQPDAAIQVVGVGGVEAKIDGFATGVDLGEAFAAVLGQGSDLLGALARSADAAPSIVVLLTDGLATDEASGQQALLARVAAGAPVLAIHTTTSAGESAGVPLLQQIAALTGGRYVDGQDLASPEIVSQALAEVLGRAKAAPYVLGYRAAAGQPALRHIAVKVGGVSAQTSYTAPAAPGPRRALAGLYLRITVQGRDPIERTLAGWSHAYSPTPEEPLPADLDAQLRAAARGIALVAFEGGAPSGSTSLAEIIGGRLAWKDAFEAMEAGDSAAALAALGEGGDPCLAAVRSLLAPFEAGVPWVHETEGRMVLAQLRVGADHVERRLDLLPWRRVRAPGADAAASFRDTARATAQLALIEQASGSISTAALLSGKDLKLIEASSTPDAQELTWVPGAARRSFAELLDLHRDSHRLVAADGSTLAFWAIDRHTGALLGVLPDGSGGVREICNAAAAADKNASAIGNLGAFLGIPGAGAWAALGKAVAMTAVRTALAFEGLGKPGSPGDFLCDVGKGAASEGLGAVIPFAPDGYGAVGKNALTDGLADKLPCMGQSTGGAC